MKNSDIGAIIGGTSGIIAGLLMEYDFSLLTIVIISAILGFIIGKLLGKKK